MIESPRRTPASPADSIRAEAEPPADPRPARAWRLWAARAAIAMVGLSAPLIALELTLRLVGPILPGTYDTGAYLIRDAALGHLHVPNFDGWIKASGYTTHVRIGPLGLRDRRSDYAKPNGVFRVLLLGDSFVEGVQVPDGNTVAERLEAALNARRVRPFEVINAGVAGYGTTQELLLLESEGLKYQPDLVVLVFFVGNDLINNNYRLELPDGNLKLALKPYFDEDSRGNVRFIPAPPPPPRDGLRDVLRARSALFNVIETGVMQKLDSGWMREEHGAIGGLREPLRGVYDTEPDSEWQRAWRISEILIGRMRDVSAGVGAQLLLVGAPEARALDPDAWRHDVAGARLDSGRLQIGAPTDRLAEVAERLGVPYVDLLPPFRDENWGEGLYIPKDVHWTARGHAAAAAVILRAMTEHGLLAH